MSTEKCEACNAGYGIELDRCHGYSHANAAIQRVRNLHRQINGPYDDLTCSECAQDEEYYPEWPCDTIKALDGEQ